MARVNEIAIDLGTSNVLIYGRGHGILAKIPAVVAVNHEIGKIVKFGEEAKQMVGRTPRHILTVYPLRDGIIRDQALVNELLQYSVGEALGHKKSFFSKPKAMIAAPSKINAAERGLINGALYDAGLGHTHSLNRCLAAVIGMNISMDDPTGTMIIDMGGSVTDISVISMGRVMEHVCVSIGGDSFDDAIIRYIHHAFSMQIGVATAENLKIQYTTALKTNQKHDIEVCGRLMTTNLPHKITITNYDLTDAINEPQQRLVYEIQEVLRRTDPALVADIYMYGAVLSGGPARMPGLADAIGLALDLPVVVADNVDENIVTGCSIALSNIRAYSSYLDDGR